MRRKLIASGIIIALLALLFVSAGSFAYARSNMGDLNGNGELDAADAALLLRHLVKLETLSPEQLALADVDGNGDISSNDASVILRYLAKVQKVIGPCVVNFTVIVTADMEGEAWPYDTITGELTGSALHTAAYIDLVRANTENNLILDGGNGFFGSNFISSDSELYPMTTVFTDMDYDAVLLGNEDFSQGLQKLRTQVDALKASGISVITANYIKNDATTAEAENAPWNDCSPYIIKEFQNSFGESVRVGVIGLSDSNLEYSDEFYGVGGVEIRSMLDMYRYYEQELTANCDFIIVLAHSAVEADALVGGDYDSSVRALVENTGSIDLVICGHSILDHQVAIENNRGMEVAVIGTGAEVQTVCHAEISYHTIDGYAICSIGCIDTMEIDPNYPLYQKLSPIAEQFSDIGSTRLGMLQSSIPPIYNQLIPSDWMTLLHKSHIWAVEQWRDENLSDLPSEIISIAYPYLNLTETLHSGALTVRDIYGFEIDNPSITLTLLTGRELRAWLEAYAVNIEGDEAVYSVYGINYRLNPKETEGERVVYMEHTYGVEIGDNEVFTVIVAEKGEGGSLLSAYLEEDMGTWADRTIEFELSGLETLSLPYRIRAAGFLAYYLGNTGAYSPQTYTTWSVVE
ncbi:MAG: dockerin type I domain-containing protein [Clostridia bacterium]|nr:dockerin type I domain-containing protein [Clostridia bacterium]